jgi:hypothetical protein
MLKKCFICAVVALGVSGYARGGDITYTFDTSAQGWLGYNQVFQPTGGNPGGFVSAPGDWVGPSSLSGDLSSYIGGLVSFDMKVGIPSTNGPAIIFAPADRLQNASFVFTPSSTPNAWTHYSAPLLASRSGLGGIGFLFPGIMSNVNFVELSVGAIAGPFGLDNFHMEHGSRVDPPTSGPGSTATNPVLPTSTSPSGFQFGGTSSGAYVDPPTASSYHYVMTGKSLFTYVDGFPSGFSHPFTVFSGGQLIGSYQPGDEIDFTKLPGGGVSEFTISAIVPGTDPTDPGAFPLRLTFDTATADFVIDPGISSTPEPASITLLGIAIAGMAGYGWRWKRKTALAA